MQTTSIEAYDDTLYPYLTRDLPGLGGQVRVELEDFQVVEVPSYLPGGEGEHLYLWIEKRGLTTRAVLEYFVEALGIPEKSVGVAGLKDKHALTRQWFSLPASVEEQLSGLTLWPGLRILETGRHSNKLGIGHLRGNRFHLLLRNPSRSLAEAETMLAVLAERGVPNYFGPQRFGLGGQNPPRGLAILRDPKAHGRTWLKRFLIGSVQSLLFNDWVALRMERGFYNTVIEGDIAKKHDSGGEFLVEDAERESPRAHRLEISATGALFGRKYFESQSAARVLEDEVLDRHNLTRAVFQARKGARRPLRFPLADWRVEATPEGLWFSFFLPKGSYATAVLRELVKAPLDTADDEPTPGSDGF